MGADSRAAAAEQDAVSMNCRRVESNNVAPLRYDDLLLLRRFDGEYAPTSTLIKPDLDAR